MPIDDRIVRAFEAAIGEGEIDEDTSVTSLPAWDSLAHINLILALEEEYGVSLTADEAASMLSVHEIERVLGTRDG